LKIGIAGATGEVGMTMIRLIEEYEIDPDELILFASKRSAGKRLQYKGKLIMVKELTEDEMKKEYDYLLFSAGAGVSKRFAMVAAEYGNTVIDNSSAFRRDEAVPLVVPEINGEKLRKYKGIVANPNCSTIQMVLALNGIKQYGINEIIVSTYQSVSGAGHSALEEYRAEVTGKDHSEFPEPAFSHGIFGNVIPLIGTLDETTGISSEDAKMIFETRKIFDDETINVYPFTARVPTEYSHGESVFLRLESDMNKDDFCEAVAATPGVKVMDDIITPVDTKGTDTTVVGRVRQFDNRTFMFWVVADNIRVGAATNALRILIKHRKLNERS